MQHKLCVMSLIMLWISVAVIVCLCQAAQPSDLFSLVAREDVEGIEALVASKPALLNKAGSGGQTPLMSAVLSGKAKAVEVLLKSGADVTIGEQDGYTPMHGAGFQGRAEIAQILLNHGLSALDVHEDGFTPFHRACWGNEQRHTDTVEVFLKAGVPVDTRAADGKTCRKMTQNRATKKLLKRYEDKAAKEL